MTVHRSRAFPWWHRLVYRRLAVPAEQVRETDSLRAGDQTTYARIFTIRRWHESNGLLITQIFIDPRGDDSGRSPVSTYDEGRLVDVRRLRFPVHPGRRPVGGTPVDAS